MVNKSSRSIAWPSRALAFILFAALLVGCTAPAAEDMAAGRVYTPLQDPVATISARAAAQTTNNGSGAGRTIAISYPAASASVTDAFPLVATPDPPLPPIAPPRLGQMVTAIEMEHAQEMAAAEAEAAAAAALLPPDPNIPQARVQTNGGDPFDWATSENYLVLGTDRRTEGGSWRTDSIMVIGLDRAKERAAVFSVPRDLYVQIPGFGWGRINQADYMGERRTPDGGGPALVSSILEEQLGIGTQHWVRIQMDGFVQFVDAMGGVDVYLDCPFSEPILNLDTNAWTNFTLPAGMNHLDGEDAYWFARLRLRETDIGRSSRQRAIIWALREQILSTNAILRLPQLYTAFRDTISTDLSLFDIIGLAQFGVSLKPENVRAGGLTLKDLQDYTTAGGAQVLIIGNPNRVRELVANVWDQPAMADAYRKDGSACEGGIPAPDPDATPLPQTESAPAGEAAPPEEATPADEAAPDGATGAIGGFAAAAAATATANFSATPAPLPDTIVDPVTGALFDAATGYPIDPETGLPYDPVTGLPIAPAPGNP